MNLWSTVKSDANVRARLLGLRASLKFIIDKLEAYTASGKPDFRPIFVHGIESYVTEPVEVLETTLPSLFILWELLQAIDLIRNLLWDHQGDVAGMEKNLPTLKREAEEAAKLARKICVSVEATLDKMKPIGIAL